VSHSHRCENIKSCIHSTCIVWCSCREVAKLVGFFFCHCGNIGRVKNVESCTCA
jgi:hypothetical protein